MLKLESVHKSFKKKHVLKGISYNFEPDKIYVIIGESGSGKSTLMNCICGLEQISEGTIAYNNTLWDNGKILEKPNNRGVGISFQNYSLFPNMSVVENIDFVKQKDSKTSTEGLLNKLGIAHLKDSRPHQLSGGQQQRAAIARCIAMEPHIVLLDEPFSSLDESIKHKVRTEIYSLLRKQQPISIIISHDPNDALNYADIVLVIKDGELIQDGTPEEVYNRPKNHYVAQLFGRINSIDGKLIRPENVQVKKGGAYEVLQKMFNGDTFLYEITYKDQQSIFATTNLHLEKGDKVDVVV